MAAVCVLLQLPREAVVSARLVPSADAGWRRLGGGTVEVVAAAAPCDGRRDCDLGRCRLQEWSVVRTGMGISDGEVAWEAASAHACIGESVCMQCSMQH